MSFLAASAVFGGSVTLRAANPSPESEMRVEGSAMRVSGISGDTVTVTDTAGHSISISAAGRNEVVFASPATGIYLVSEGHSTVKVVVR